MTPGAWFPHKNAAGIWCAAKDGVHEAARSHGAAVALCIELQRADDEEAALADLTQNTNPRAGANDDQ